MPFLSKLQVLWPSGLCWGHAPPVLGLRARNRQLGAPRGSSQALCARSNGRDGGGAAFPASRSLCTAVARPTATCSMQDVFNERFGRRSHDSARRTDAPACPAAPSKLTCSRANSCVPHFGPRSIAPPAFRSPTQACTASASTDIVFPDLVSTDARQRGATDPADASPHHVSPRHVPARSGAPLRPVDAAPQHRTAAETDADSIRASGISADGTPAVPVSHRPCGCAPGCTTRPVAPLLLSPLTMHPVPRQTSSEMPLWRHRLARHATRRRAATRSMTTCGAFSAPGPGGINTGDINTSDGVLRVDEAAHLNPICLKKLS